jgi:transposase
MDLAATPQSQSIASIPNGQGYSEPFSEQFITISKKERIQLICDRNFWNAQHTRAVEREEKLAEELRLARGEIRELKQQLFGKKTEKGTPRSDQVFIGEKSGKPRGQQPGSSGHGRTKRKNLQVREEQSEIPSDEACCPCCGLPWNELPGTEDSEYIEIEVSAYTRLIRRKRYVPCCKCGVTPGIVTAPAPARILPRNTLGVSVWTDVLLDKFLYARATNRLLQAYQSYGLPIAAGTISGGLKRLAPLFDPLREAFHAKQMSESLFFGDETRWRVFETVEGKTGNRWWLWIVISESVTYYRLEQSRGAKVPLEHFSPLADSTIERIFVCDRFSSYKKMAKEMAIFVLAFCWAHVRRDFIKAARKNSQEKEWMLGWVLMIRDLYRINRTRMAHWNPDKALTSQSSAFITQQRVLEEALQRMVDSRETCLAQSDLSDSKRAVLTSLMNHHEGLTVFVQHPQVHMDNNISERAARKGAMGRNNYYGSGSIWSGNLMATMFTLFQTLRQWKIDPRCWLTSYLNACADNGGKPPDDLTSFLPWQMSDEHKQHLQRPLTSPP